MVIEIGNFETYLQAQIKCAEIMSDKIRPKYAFETIMEPDGQDFTEKGCSVVFKGTIKNKPITLVWFGDYWYRCEKCKFCLVDREICKKYHKPISLTDDACISYRHCADNYMEFSDDNPWKDD